MRQLSLLAVMAVAAFVTISLIFMSRTSALRESSSSFITDRQPPHATTPKEASQIAQLAKTGPSLGVDHLDNIDVDRQIKSSVTPELTQGHVIMPQLTNETVK